MSASEAAARVDPDGEPAEMEISVSYQPALDVIRELEQRASEAQALMKKLSTGLSELVGPIQESGDGDGGESTSELRAAAKVLGHKLKDLEEIGQGLKKLREHVPRRPTPLEDGADDQAPWHDRMQELLAQPEDASGPDMPVIKVKKEPVSGKRRRRQLEEQEDDDEEHAGPGGDDD